MLTMDEGLAPKKPGVKVPTAIPATTPAQTAKPTPYGAPKAPGVLTSSSGDGFGSTPGTTGGGLTQVAPPTPIQAPGPIAPSQPAPTAIPATPAAPASPAAPALPVTTTPTNPNNPLTAQTIQPGQLADRVGQAQQAWQTWLQGTDPAYQATLRQAKRVGAAAGGLGSGQLRTSIGDLGAQRANAMDVRGQELLQGALQGQNEDVWRSIGLAERQQGFQNTQQQQAFENELRRLGFDDSLINSELGRALQVYMAGQTGGTGSGTALGAAGGFANQGQDALDALTALIRNRAAAPQTTAADPLPVGQVYPWMGGGANG